MTFEEFSSSLTGTTPPASLSPALVALWHDGRGNWEKAHEIAQDMHTPTGSQLHAYLHRKEGDEGNANYWYRQAGVAFGSGSLQDEWRVIVTALLKA